MPPTAPERAARMAGAVAGSLQRQYNFTAKPQLLLIQVRCTGSELPNLTANWACQSDQRKVSSGSSALPNTQLPSSLMPCTSLRSCTNGESITLCLLIMSIPLSYLLRLRSWAMHQVLTALASATNTERWGVRRIQRCPSTTTCVMSTQYTYQLTKKFSVAEYRRSAESSRCLLCADSLVSRRFAGGASAI